MGRGTAGISSVDAWLTGLGVAPNICYGTGNGRAMRTAAGAPDSGYSSIGLAVTTCDGVHFDPTRSSSPIPLSGWRA